MVPRKRLVHRIRKDMDMRMDMDMPQETRIQFRPKRQRQSLASEQKPLPLPPIQLREVFSNSLFYLRQLNSRNDEKFLALFGRYRITHNANGLAGPPVGDAVETQRVGSCCGSSAGKRNHRSSR